MDPQDGVILGMTRSPKTGSSGLPPTEPVPVFPWGLWGLTRKIKGIEQ